MSTLRRAALAFTFLWFLVGGIGHFVNTAFFVRIVPDWVPWPLAAVYVSGVFELLGAFGLIPANTRRSAGLGLLALIICVTPVHLYMLQHPQRFAEIPLELLWLRMLIQVLFFACVWWATQPRAARV